MISDNFTNDLANKSANKSAKKKKKEIEELCDENFYGDGFLYGSDDIIKSEKQIKKVYNFMHLKNKKFGKTTAKPKVCKEEIVFDIISRPLYYHKSNKSNKSNNKKNASNLITKYYSEVDIILNLCTYWNKEYTGPIKISINKLTSVLKDKSLIETLNENCYCQKFYFNPKKTTMEIIYFSSIKYSQTDDENIVKITNMEDFSNKCNCPFVCYILTIQNSKFYYKNISIQKNNFDYIKNIKSKKKSNTKKTMLNEINDNKCEIDESNIIYKLYNIDKFDQTADQIVNQIVNQNGDEEFNLNCNNNENHTKYPSFDNSLY